MLSMLNPVANRGSVGWLAVVVVLAVTVPLAGMQAQPPRLIDKVEPLCSNEAKDAGTEGTIVLRLEIGTDGKPGKIVVTRGVAPNVDQCVIDAVSQWRFEPGRKNGKPVPVEESIETRVRFQ